MSSEIFQAGKNEKRHTTQGTDPMKPLADLSLDDWGATAMEFNRRARMKVALENRARKSAYQSPKRTNLGRFAPRIVPDLDDVFVTSSGMKAVRVVGVSLPFVSIQHEGRGR